MKIMKSKTHGIIYGLEKPPLNKITPNQNQIKLKILAQINH